MRIRGEARAGTLLLALTTVVMAGCLPDGGSGSDAAGDGPDPPAADAYGVLWLATADGVLRLDPPATAPLERIEVADPVDAMAVDPLSSDLWRMEGADLIVHPRDGDTRVFDAPATGPGNPATLTTGRDARGVWAARANTVEHRSDDGAIKTSHALTTPVTDLVLDGDDQAWVASGHRVYRIDESGAEPVLHLATSIRALAMDPEGPGIWVATDTLVGYHTPTGELLHTTPATGVTHLADDGDGSVWIVRPNHVTHLHRSGGVSFHIDPRPGEEWMAVDAVADPRDGGLWLASKDWVIEIDTDGTAADALEPASPITALALAIDPDAPRLAFLHPETDAYLPDPRPDVRLAVEAGPPGIDTNNLTLRVDGDEWKIACDMKTDTVHCVPQSDLPEGALLLEASARDHWGRDGTAEQYITIDTTPPVLTVEEPLDGSHTNEAIAAIQGSVNEPASVTINGHSVDVSVDHRFETTIVLAEGHNEVALSATDRAGNATHRTLNVVLDTTAPAPIDDGAVTIDALSERGHYQVQGASGSAAANLDVHITNTVSGSEWQTHTDSDGAFDISVRAQTGDVLHMTVTDTAGNQSEALQVTVGDIPLPPDPADVAPPLPTGVTEPLHLATRFLYDGDRPVQYGVETGAIEPRRAAVVRGRVMLRDGNPLSGVRVAVHNAPGLGYTYTRADGRFDLAVNGGRVTLEFRRDGYLPAQRRLHVTWADYTQAPVVALVPRSEVVTRIALDDDTPPMQTARGNRVEDADGTRQATLLFGSGTSAAMVLPDGTHEPLSVLDIRVTEYTVGPDGPQAMPASLPPESGYTYAVELSADQAEAAGARHVVFDRPVAVYVENFLDFPVGGPVPAGYYNRATSRWSPSDDGRVIRIVGVNEGRAELDLDGDGDPASPAALAALGITDGERDELGKLYTPGQSLWRVPVTHFTPWDFNWPFGPPGDAVTHAEPMEGATEPREDQPDCQSGSIIECQNRVLGETINLTGIPFSLHYRSDRVHGRKATRTIDFTVIGSTVPDGLKRAVVELTVAGRQFRETFAPQADTHYTLTWDGLDGYGRRATGRQPVQIRIGYVYNASYREPAPGGRSFGRSGGTTLTGNASRQEVTLWRTWRGSLGVWDGLGTGGWSLAPHHFYDTGSGELLRGDGGRITAGEVLPIVETVAGTGASGHSGDGGPADEASLGGPWGATFDPDGTLYIADTASHRVRRVDLDGTITTVAGTGDRGSAGDGGPAVDAELNDPFDVAVGPDGSVYVAESRGYRVRRIRPDGIIETVAGTGEAGDSGDNGPATQAELNRPDGVAVDQEGNLYIADRLNNRVRRVDTMGTITTVAGLGEAGFSGDGGPADQAHLNGPYGVDVDLHGRLLIADQINRRVRIVGTDGIIDTFAGNGTFGNDGDGGPATAAAMGQVFDIATDSRGNTYVATASSNTLRVIHGDGTIHTIAGNGSYEVYGAGGPALDAGLGWFTGVAVDPERDEPVIVSARLFRVTSPMPRTAVDEVVIGSRDGKHRYVFSARGLHQRTESALTGATIHHFEYDDTAQLTAITDHDGNRTKIERDSEGRATALIGPHGNSYSLTLDTNGYLGIIEGPDGRTKRFGYTAGGLLTSRTTAGGHTFDRTYDAMGRLTETSNPEGGGWTISGDARDDHIQMSSGGGRLFQYSVTGAMRGARHREKILPDGTRESIDFATDGGIHLVEPDGTQLSVGYEPDPRLGMQAPFPTDFSLTTTGGRSLSGSLSRDLEQPTNGSLLPPTVTETLSIGSRTYEREFDPGQQQWTYTTPAGRQFRVNIDAAGRPLSRIRPGLATKTFDYDSRGRLIRRGLDAGDDSRTVRFEYDEQGQLKSLTDPLGRTTTLTYDTGGRAVEQHLPGHRENRFLYNADNHVTAVVPPASTAHLFEYNATGAETRYAPPELPTEDGGVTYSYDADGRVTHVGRGQGLDIAFEYGASGRLSRLELSDRVIDYSYADATGHLVALDSTDGEGLELERDGPLLLAQRWSGSIAGEVIYSYGPDLQISGITAGGQNIEYHHDADGLITVAGELSINRDDTTALPVSTVLGNVSTNREYNDFGELVSKTVTHDGDSLYTLTITRDDAGRIISKVESLGSDGQNRHYAYDQAGRLTTVNTDSAQIASYTYDANGNRIQTTAAGVITDAEHDAQDRLISYGSTEFTYRSDGTRIGRGADGQHTTYDYDVLGHLRRVDDSLESTVDYILDPLGRRVARLVDGELQQGFLYLDSLNPVAELRPDGTARSVFIYGTRPHVPDYMIRNDRLYRIVSNELGTPRLVVDAQTGDIAQRLDYGPFGTVIGDTNPGFQPFGFAGGLYDPTTGLVRFGTRDYDPFVGRWTAKDPIGFAGGDTNLYAYAANDPINYIDPDGRAFWPSAAFGAVIGGISSGLGAIAAGQGPTSIAKASIIGAFSGAIAGLHNPSSMVAHVTSGGAIAGLENLFGQMYALRGSDCARINTGAFLGATIGGALGSGRAGLARGQPGDYTNFAESLSRGVIAGKVMLPTTAFGIAIYNANTNNGTR